MSAIITDLMQLADIERLAAIAWQYRDRALVLGRTRVGAAAMAGDGSIYGGCNIQHRFRTHDVHAEVAAITTMVAAGRRHLSAIIVVSDFKGLTPCGSCLDWILQLGGDDCFVAWQGAQGEEILSRRAVELMPFHPPYTEVSGG